jgi:hypothetical protein
MKDTCISLRLHLRSFLSFMSWYKLGPRSSKTMTK